MMKHGKHEDKSFFKDLFLLEIKSNSFEIDAILFFKELFSFKIKSSFEDKTSFFFKTMSQSFYFLKFCFHLREDQVGISMSPFHLKSHPSLTKQY